MGLTEDPFPADDRLRSSSSGLRRMPLSGPTDPEGGSTNIESLPVIDLFAFRCEWLETRGSAAESCSAIEVPDDSMEPTLQAGASILVDHRGTRRQGNGVFALQVGDEFGTLRLRSTSPSIPGARPVAAPASSVPLTQARRQTVGKTHGRRYSRPSKRFASTSSPKLSFAASNCSLRSVRQAMLPRCTSPEAQ